MTGVDVSLPIRGTYDWAAVAGDGIEFGHARVGSRSYLRRHPGGRQFEPIWPGRRRTGFRSDAISSLRR